MKAAEQPKPRVLITGGYGFVGSNLTDFIRSNMKGYNPFRFSSEKFDLTKQDEARILFRASEPDVVVHLAATCGGIFANMMNPATFWADNLRMGMNILDACVEYGVKKLVMLGSVCSYPKVAPLPFTEDSLCAGWPEITNRPYGIAKLALYEGCRAYGIQHNLKFSYLIPTNLYGPYDNFDLDSSHVIPGVLRKFHEAVRRDQSTVELWGDGTPTRDFLYAEDAARAISMTIGRDTGTLPINLGSGQETSMGALVEMIRTVTGFEGDVVWNIDRPNGQPRRAVDATHAKNVLGWTPTTGVFEGIQRTYRWYLQNGAMTDPKIATE